MAKKYIVDLTDAERQQLLELTSKGSCAARKVKRAHILLLADAGDTDEVIAESLHAGVATVERIRQRFVEEGLAVALVDKPRPGGQRLLDSHQEAFLVALACSPAPEGSARWTLSLLAERMVALGVVDTLSDDTVGRRLKQTSSNPG
jgi:transposase